MAIEDKVREASELLQEAYEESECKWCARNLEKLAEITEQMADISPFTAETAKQVSKKTEKEIKAIGGKVRVLHDVVVQAQRNDGNTTGVSKTFNREDGYIIDRGLSMDKRSATLIIGGALGIGVGAGFVLNRVDQMYPASTWYMRIGPAANVLGGLALAILGMSGKITKKPSTQTMLVAGGAAMMSNGALAYLESLYSQMGGTAGRAVRGRVNARPGYLPTPGPIRLVNQVKSF